MLMMLMSRVRRECPLILLVGAIRNGGFFCFGYLQTDILVVFNDLSIEDNYLV